MAVYLDEQIIWTSVEDPNDRNYSDDRVVRLPNRPLPGLEEWDLRERETPQTLTALSLTEIFLTAAGFNAPDITWSRKILAKITKSQIMVNFRKVSDSKVKQEGLEEIRKVDACEVSGSNVQQGGQEEFSKVGGGNIGQRGRNTANGRMPKRCSTQETSSWGGACGMTWKRLNVSARPRPSKRKRDKWKAASARYYLKHPEIKEKKRAKMAEKRAARKLARRRWDPPKVARRPDGEGQLGDFSGTPDLDVEDGGPRSPEGFSGHLEGWPRQGRYGGRLAPDYPSSDK
ncbi:hypothetical protein B0H14DRAFT_2604629 [Mycena olivaceomarginata]|nr:hypothetical protein B0H14DRAFT_2604629 [Mycena olivaceomarginata]